MSLVHKGIVSTHRDKQQVIGGARPSSSRLHLSRVARRSCQSPASERRIFCEQHISRTMCETEVNMVGSPERGVAAIGLEDAEHSVISRKEEDTSR